MTDHSLKDKYIHADHWDWDSDNAPLRALRAQLAAEWDEKTRDPAGLTGIGAAEFMARSRAVVRRMLEGMERRHYIVNADILYSALFPFPDKPCAGDMLLMDALAAWTDGDAYDKRQTTLR